MPKIYYAKIFLKGFDKTVKQISLQTFGSSEPDATHNISRMIETWTSIRNYEVLKISTQRILMEKYVIQVDLKYQNGDSKQIKININAESETDAESFFRRMLTHWGHVVSVQVLKIEKRIKNNYYDG